VLRVLRMKLRDFLKTIPILEKNNISGILISTLRESFIQLSLGRKYFAAFLFIK